MSDTIEVIGTYTVAAGVDLTIKDQNGFDLVAGPPEPSLIIDGHVSVIGGKDTSSPYGAVAFGGQDDSGASVRIDTGGVLSVRAPGGPEGVVFEYQDSSFTNQGRLLVIDTGKLGSAIGVEANGAGDIIDNDGLIQVIAGDGGAGVLDSLLEGGQVTNTGRIILNGGVGGSTGVGIGDNSSFNNSGLLRVTSGFDAVGVLARADSTVLNSGTIKVLATGHSDGAMGVELTSGSFTNTGDISATGVPYATGVRIDQVDSDISNQGDIVAATTGRHGTSLGLVMNAGVAGATEIDNGGLIHADIAIQLNDTLGAARDLTIHNSGRIEGAIDLGFGDDGLTNTGVITGAVNLGAGDDIYNGSTGVLVGVLSGGDGDDRLIGGAGAETLYGGDGADTMTGGGGADDFVFHSIKDSKGVKDQITDLTNADAIDLSHIDADTTQAGNQAFVVVSAFDHHAGELVLTYHSGADITTLSADVDGDGQADMQIILSGDHHDFTNFVL